MGTDAGDLLVFDADTLAFKREFFERAVTIKSLCNIDGHLFVSKSIMGYVLYISEPAY